ncbi:MAG: carboxylesterase/lipase family protein [Prevotella sp.]|jgi:para-nitrobenzyl esterase|nr:carboxylesterase/lipase family protein [Prevotella sp.]
MTKRLSTFLLAVLLTAIGASAQPITAGPHTRVETAYGTIEGYQDGSIFTFKGIPYAQAERFMPPQPPAKVEGIRQCKVYGPQAPQGESLRWNARNSQTDYGFGNQFVTEPMDERECLVLNVWTPGLGSKKLRPVFVWIHGGGYAGGSGHDLPCYEGRALAEAGDIVVVNLNHRLNILGYADLTGLGGKYAQSVNLGMQDIVKALEWVRDNIARFGGNPDEVTIGGQSGGGGKVSTLLAMPSAKGLFKRAIVQSGSTLRQALPEQTRPYGIALAQELGQPATAEADFSKYTYDELNYAVQRLAQRGMRSAFSPVVDGVILPQHPFEPAPPTANDVPMLIGTDFNEFTFDISHDMTWAEAEEVVRKRQGDKAEQYIAAFKKAYPQAEPKEMTYVDTGFRAGAVRQAAAKAAQGGAPAYLYLFTWKPESNALGASHGMELPFMLHNVSLQREMTGASPAAYRFEKLISNIWLSFIKTGNPNVKGLPKWEPYNEETGVTMILDNKCYPLQHHDRELMQMSRSLW